MPPKSNDKKSDILIHETGQILDNADQDPSPRLVKLKDADVTLSFMNQYDSDIREITLQEEKELSTKIKWVIVPIAFLVNLLLFMDKATLSYASILGLFDDTGLSKSQYNDANSLYYVGYLIGNIPGHLLMQRLPIGKLLTVQVFIWSIIIFLHCTAHNPSGVYALRFFLGVVESYVTSLLVIVQSFFLTPSERSAVQPIFYASAFASDIPTGFIAFGVLHTKNSLHPWKIFMIIIGGFTFLTSIFLFYFFPNNPTNAKFLTIQERVWTIRRIQKASRSSIELNRFKKYQMIESLKDPISWLFVLFMFCLNLGNNLNYQKNLLYSGIGGMSRIKTTYITVIQACFSILCSASASYIMSKVRNIRAYVAFGWCIPSVIGGILMVSLSYENKIGLVGSLMLAASTHAITWIIGYSWTVTSTSGLTKIYTRSVMVMIAYSVSNIIAPQIWREKDSPRYYPAWIIQIVIAWSFAPTILLLIDLILRRRNKKRLSNIGELTYGYVQIEGGEEEAVDIAALDLTDLENETFIYEL